MLSVSRSTSLPGETGIVLQQNRFAREAIAEHGAAFLDLELLRARHRDAQTHRDIVRDVIAADCEHAALFHRAVDIEHVIGRPAADIDDERAEIFLMLGEDDLRGGERREDDILHIERQFFDASDRVLNPRSHAVDDVEIGLQFLAEHSDRIEHAVLPVDVIMLDDRVQKRVLRRDAHFARVDLYVLDILLVDLVAVFRQTSTQPRLLKL